MVLHHQVKQAILLAEIEQFEDMGVIERRNRLRLALEPSEKVGIVGKLGIDDLDRHVTIDSRLPRLVDRCHPSLAQQVADLVLPKSTPCEYRHVISPFGQRSLAA